MMERSRKYRALSLAPNKQKQYLIDVEDLFSSLNHSIRLKGNESSSEIKEKSIQLQETLASLKEKIKILDFNEKNNCITQGGITILIQCLCFCGKNSINNDSIIEICQQLIDNSHDASRLFCKQIISHLYNDIECIGISDVLTKIISFYPLRSIFIEDLCIPKLLEIYYKCSLALAKLNFKTDPTIFINTNPINNIIENISNNNNTSTANTANTANSVNNHNNNHHNHNHNNNHHNHNHNHNYNKINGNNNSIENDNFHRFQNINIPSWSEDGQPPTLPKGFSFENLLSSVPIPKPQKERDQILTARDHLYQQPTTPNSQSITSPNNINNLTHSSTTTTPTLLSNSNNTTNNGNSNNNSNNNVNVNNKPTSISQISTIQYHNPTLYQTPPLFNRNRGNNSLNNDSTTSSPSDSPLISASAISQHHRDHITNSSGTPTSNRIVPLLPLSNSLNNSGNHHIHYNNNTPTSTGSNNINTPTSTQQQSVSLPTSPPLSNTPASANIITKLSLGGLNSKIAVPKLNLPIRVENNARMTRSSRRREDGQSNSTRSHQGDNILKFETNATKELIDIANKLGETYMTADLTALISYKQAIESHKQSKRSITSKRYDQPPIINSNQHAILLLHKNSNSSLLSESNLYKVRCNILKTLISSTSNNLMLLQYGNNPINMLYSESILLHKGIIPSDRDHLNLFYKLASHWSDYVEYIHRNRWFDFTKDMTLNRKASFRKKLDLLIWRINSSVSSMLETYIFDDLEYQLCVLAEYIKNCPSRVLSHQVVDVCIESLLKVKHTFFRGPITPDRIKDLHIVHYLLTILDEVIKQNEQAALNDFFISILLERDESFQFIKQYTIQILTNEAIEKEFIKCYPNDPNKTKLTEFRCRAIKHFSVCIKMLKFKEEVLISNQLVNNVNNNLNYNNINNNNNSNNSNNSNGNGNGNSNGNNNCNSNSNSNSGSNSSNYNNSAQVTTPHSQQQQQQVYQQQENEILELVKKLEFLLTPTQGGIILPYLQNSTSFFQNFILKKQMLKFLNHVFLFKKTPFTKKKLYVDSYISYIYISFIKLYNNYIFDQATLTLCKLFLNILIAFSVNKNEKISMKFYQLRIMDFLVREVNLEYEIKQNKDQFLKPLSSIPFFSCDNSNDSPTNNSNSNSVAIINNSSSSSTTTIPISTSTNNQGGKISLSLNLTGIKKTDQIDNNTQPNGVTDSANKPKVPPLLKLPLKTDSNNNTTQPPAIPKLSLPTVNNNNNGNISDTKPVIPKLALGGGNSNNNTTPVTTDSKPTIPKLALGGNTNNNTPVTTDTKPVIPKLALGGGNNTNPVTTDSKPVIPKLALGSSTNNNNTPATTDSKPLVPKLALGGGNSNNNTTPVTTDSKPTIPKLALGNNSNNNNTVSTESKPTIPKLALGGNTNNNNTTPVATDSKPTIPKLALGNNTTPVTTDSKPTIPKLALGGNNNSNTTPVTADNTNSVSTDSKPIVPKLSLGGNNNTNKDSSNSNENKSTKPTVKFALNLSTVSKGSSASTSTNNLNAISNSSTTVQNPTNISDSKPPIGKMNISIPKLKLPAIKIRTEEEAKQASSGVLSSIEQKIDPQDPKFQLVLDNISQSLTPNATDRDTEQIEPTENEIFNENQRYQMERNNRKLYHDRDLHISLLQLIFSLLLNSNETLEHLYSDQFPIVAKKLNVPFILHLHINHHDNEKIIPELTKKTHEMGPNHFRILKLLFNRLYHSSLFKDLKRVAKGAYGTVYKGTLGIDEGLEIAVKLMPVPKTIHDRCVLYDIFTEILIMDTFREDSRGCHMFDYGVDGENYWIVMKSYKCSLKEWRLKQTLPFLQQLPLLLNIYTLVLQSVQFLADHKINHFDIKCDNFLVHPLKKGTIEEDFWNQPTNDPNFAVCLADWGEAKVYTLDVEGYTTRNRGTEFIKSPEMLTIAYASQKTRENFDRRKKVGSNTASDVWSLGCLFYELLTGDFLFYDNDWVKFFIRVTQPGQELITPERKSKVANIPAILEFFDYVFVRDPFYRPSLRDLLTKFNAIKPVILQQLEQLKEKANPGINSISQQPKQYYNGGDGTRYKGKNTRISGLYTPGRFLPHNVNISTKGGTLAAGSNISKPKDYMEEEIPYEPPEFPEHRFYMDRPSQIAPYMYISSFNPSMNKNMLINEFQITHIINCTGSPNAFPDHFEYLHLQLHDQPSQDIVQSLMSAFDFIREAICRHGKVLICSDKGVSRSSALAIAYFMESKSISYFEAFILIRDCRYIISPNPGFVEQLCRWGKQRRTLKGLAEWSGGETNTIRYQCLCGSCSFTLLAPFDNPPRKCNCEGSDSSDSCPNSRYGCSNFLYDMKKVHGYNNNGSRYLEWGLTNTINVVGDYQRTSVIFTPPTNINSGKIKSNTGNTSSNTSSSASYSMFNGGVAGKNEYCNSGWSLFKCKFCHFITCAIKSSTTGINESISIVTNQKTNYFGLVD